MFVSRRRWVDDALPLSAWMIGQAVSGCFRCIVAVLSQLSMGLVFVVPQRSGILLRGRSDARQFGAFVGSSFEDPVLFLSVRMTVLSCRLVGNSFKPPCAAHLSGGCWLSSAGHRIGRGGLTWLRSLVDRERSHWQNEGAGGM